MLGNRYNSSDMPDLYLHKQAKRLRIYIGESDRWRGKPLDAALVEVIRARGFAGATVYRGVMGFGAHSHIHSSSIEALSSDLPIVIEVVDVNEKIEKVIEIVYPMVREGLITLDDVQIIKYTHRFLNPLPADRLVAEVMTRKVISLPAAMKIHQAWRTMFENVIKAAPVVDDRRRVVGMLTNEDLLMRAGIQQRLSVAIRMDVAEINREIHNLEASNLIVSDVMTRPAITILEAETLGSATTKMVKKGLKRLPVVNDKGELAGILSRLDILRQVATIYQEFSPDHVSPKAVKTVSECMTSNIPLVSQDDDISTIINKFTTSSSNRLIVVGSDGKAIGLISDSDVVSRIAPEKQRGILDALRKKRSPPFGKETAFDLMSPEPLTCPPDFPVVDAVKMMIDRSRKWLVVIDQDKRPMGLVDRQILLEAVTSIYPDS